MSRTLCLASRAVGPALLALGAGGCSGKGHPTPVGTFEVRLEVPAAVASAWPPPPASALRPWQVWVNQEVPRQKKNPHWRSLGAKEGALLDLAPDGRWRCLATPSQLYGKANEEGNLGHWTTTRAVRCSSDGWATQVEGQVQQGYAPDGTPGEAEEPARLYLKDVVEGVPRTTVVVLRGEPPPSKPVTRAGPESTGY